MDNINQTDLLLFEHQFWLQIMGDHARFIFYSLAPTQEEIQTADYFIRVYDELLRKAHSHLSSTELEELNKDAFNITHEFRNFKLHLLSLTLYEGLVIHLPPTFFNHMINELEEYILVLQEFNEGEIPQFAPIHYHLVWLSDAIGHAAGISSNLDEVEQDMIMRSKRFQEAFTNLYLKAIQMNGYLRTNLSTFPSLEKLNFQAENEMLPFKDLLIQIRDQRIEKTLLGTLMPLMADHMAREECYYLLKLSQTDSTINPGCNPARRRVEG